MVAVAILAMASGLYLWWSIPLTSGPASLITDRQVLAYVSAFEFSSPATEAFLEQLTEEPHPFGSTRQNMLQKWLLEAIKTHSTQSYIQPFQADTPNPLLLNRTDLPAPLTIAKSGANILALPAQARPDQDCVVLIASHYDSKDLSPRRYVGANDSASSSAALLGLLHYLGQQQPPLKLRCQLGVVWFDGEESVLPEWHDGLWRHPVKIVDNTYGSRFLAGSLQACPLLLSNPRTDLDPRSPHPPLCLPDPFPRMRLEALILLDMIGSPGLRLTPAEGSHPDLQRWVTQAAAALGYQDLVAHKSQRIEDDHVPFLERQIPAVNLIDFEHLGHWHQESDTLATISRESIEKTAKIALFLGLTMASSP